MEQNQLNLQQQFDQAVTFKVSQPQLFEQILYSIIDLVVNEPSEQDLKIKEQSYYTLAEAYAAVGNFSKIQELIVSKMDNLNAFTKTRAAKIIRLLIDQVAQTKGTEEIQISMCITLIDWCTREKKTYLRHKIQIRLASLYQQTEKYSKGLEIIDSITKEVRKADDKHMLLEIYLTESKLYFGLENISKSKASLTAARACANSIYCPPNLQAEIDLMGGILHSEEKDYVTAYSYFYEAFEAFNSLEDLEKALKSFKYMLLTKIMTNSQDDVHSLLSSKYGLKYAGKDLDAMKAINQSYKNKSLIQFNQVLTDYTNEISGDQILKLHIDSLYNALLERNLFSVIKPYSRVQISYVAKRMSLDEYTIQSKLSELILDKKVEGTLDQGNGSLILFDSIKSDNLYRNSLDVINNMNTVMEKLQDRIKSSKN